MFSPKETELLKLGLDALLETNIKLGDAERLTALALYQKLGVIANPRDEQVVCSDCQTIHSQNEGHK